MGYSSLPGLVCKIIYVERIELVVGNKFIEGDAKLPHITHTLNPLRSGLGLRQCWQEQRRKDSDDGDDNQQFNERECRAAVACRCSHT